MAVRAGGRDFARSDGRSAQGAGASATTHDRDGRADRPVSISAIIIAALGRQPATATLCGPDRAWLPLDFDDVTVPAGLGHGERLVEAALFVRDHLLPDEFHGVRMIAVPSASTGRQGDSIARLRLFAALDRPHPLRAMKDWAKGRGGDARYCRSTPRSFKAGQPIYTARPIFVSIFGE